MSDFPDWTGSSQLPAPGTAAPWSSPNKAPSSFLLSVGSHQNIIPTASATTQNFVFDLYLSVEPSGSAAYFSLEAGAFGVYTVIFYVLLSPTVAPLVLPLDGTPLGYSGGVGQGLYISLASGAVQPVIGGVTYSVG